MIIKVISKAVRNVFRGVRKVVGWLFKMPDMPDAAAVMVEKQGSDHPIPVVYGARKIGVIKVHKYVTDLPGGADNELLHLICVLCEGEIDAIEEVFFDGVSETDPRWRKDKNNANSAKWFTVHRYLGAANQAASGPAVTAIPNWTNNHTLNGLAYLYVVLQMDKDQSIWRGEPEITARVRGRKIFDPRTNTTAFSTNPAIQLLDYLQNPIYGKGLNQNRLDLPSFIAAANFADETLNSTVIVNGTPTPFTHKRFTGNQVVDTGKSVFSNVQQMLSAMRGSLPIGSGVLRLQLERDTNPVFYFSHGRSEQLNHATITGRIKSSGGSKKDRFNRVVVRFPNAALEFERDEVFYPDSEDPQFAQWLAEDNGVLLEQNFEFNTITNKAEALQVARIIALRSRFQLQCSFVASPAAIAVEPGNVVGITDDTRGWDAKPFRVEQVKLKDDGDIDLEFIEHQNAIYPWSGTTYEERTGGTNLGDPTNIPAPTGLSITPDLTLATGGRLTWSAANNAFIRRFRVQLQSGSTVLFSEETAGRSLDLPLLAPGNYSISIFAISTLNTLSPPAVIAFELTLPVPPTNIQLTSFNFEIEVRPVLAGAGLGTQFEFDCVEGDGAGHTPVVKGRGAAATFVGLKHDTVYTIFARTVNALGNSSWVSASIATTSDASNVIDLIKDPLWESVFQPVVIDLQSEFTQAVQSARDDFDAGLNDARTQLESARSELNLAISETANTAAQELQDAQQQLAAAIQTAENTASSELAAARQELAQSIASAESSLNVKLASEVVSRQKTDMALFNAAAATLQFKQTVQAGITNLQDAVFEVDPANGQLRLRAFSYTDSAFTQAQLLIDGVNAGVNILAQRVSVTETGLVDASSEINALAGQIQLRATYTEVNHAIAGAIDAVLPAYSFGFFNSTEGWTALAGSITPANGKVQLVRGDITNQALSYIADENPIISISIERTGGTGWVGSIVVTFSDAPDQLYEAVIENVPAGTAFVRNLNLAGDASYSGQVTGLRFIFGSSDADTFTVNSITIGKPSAALTELEGLSAQVNQLGVDINAVAGQLSSYVTTAFYNDNTVTLSNVEQVLDGTASVISLKATQQQINAAGTVGKANTAASWIDAAEANITQVVTAFVEQPGGVNDQLDETRQSLTNASSQINALAGRITDQIVSISAVRNKATDIAKLQFFAEHELYKQRNNLLDQGSSIALAQRDISAVTNAQQATAQELLQLSASFGAATGQFNADLQVLNTSLANETQARVSSLQQLDANLSGQINAAATQLTQAIVTEQEARANAISQLSAQFTDDITATADSFTLALSDETAARVQQIGSLQTSFGQDIAAAESRVTTLVSDESQARANAITQLQTGFADNYATISSVQQAESKIDKVSARQQEQLLSIYGVKQKASGADKTAFYNAEALLKQRNNLLDQGSSIALAQRDISAVTNAQQATAQELLQLSASFGAATGQFNADLQVLNTSLANETQARVSSLQQLDANLSGQINATATQLTQAIVTEQEARANAISQLSAQFTDDITATADSFTLALSDETAARVQQIGSLQTSFGQDIAAAESRVTTLVSDESQARANAISQLSTSFGDSLTATNQTVSQVNAKADGTAQALQGLSSEVTSLSGDLSAAELLLESAVDELGQVSGRAFLGVTTTVGGKRNVTGILFDGQENGIRLQGDIFELANTGGQPVIYWSDAGNALNIRARLVLSGGETVDKIEDIRALDGNYTEYRYRSVAAAPATPTGVNPSGWSTTPPNTTDPIWVSQAVKKADGSALVGAWSAPARWNGLKGADGAQGPQGSPGQNGAPGPAGPAFFGWTYPAISWTTSTANQRFTELMGRGPVQFDIFTQTRSDGTDSQARQYINGSWQAVALQVDGSIIARDSIAGDRFIAGTEITAPIIKGGEFIVAEDDVEYMTIIKGRPFGAQNDLVEWYGPRINGITWNSATQLPIYSGMTKANAATYKTRNGSAYFGGTIIAGVLRNAVQTSILTAAPAVESGSFGSNGGVIVINCGLSANRSSGLVLGRCPISPDANPPTGVMYLDRWNGSSWQQVASQSMTGTYECLDEDPEHIENWQIQGSFTYTDTLMSTANRQYRLRAIHNVPLLPNGTLRLALVTQE